MLARVSKRWDLISFPLQLIAHCILIAISYHISDVALSRAASMNAWMCIIHAPTVPPILAAIGDKETSIKIKTNKDLSILNDKKAAV